MKRKFVLLFISILIPTSLLCGHKVYAKVMRNNELNELRSCKSISDYQNEDFTIIKEYDSTNLTRKTIKNSKDYISKIDSNISLKDLKGKDSDVLLLAHLIESEAGNEPYEGKLAVASVVVNREMFDGKDLESVIFEKNQFDGVNTNNFKITPSGDSIKAAQTILAGNITLKNAYYFANLKLCSPSFAKESTFICRIGDHWFFRKD